ncbi:hypothetical protein PRZ48_013014 [Zasmidium cellare]|uniref:C2H2-type domain-containing protein n=1 Tax=Zasmidium cellare TaxID=395010 RepID=A0ABR0E3G1_ZASCE|nr:hypothetical protein PRZ48_013014 [Zasmidium cellare]
MKLGDISAAYLAYQKLGRLPKNAPEFEYTSKGYPILHFGERYCRAIHPITGGTCGHASQTRSALENHLNSVHDFTSDKKPAHARKYSVVQYKEAARFYESLMKDETYSSPERKKSTSNLASSATPRPHPHPPPRKKDNDDDDDEIFVKRRAPTKQMQCGTTSEKKDGDGPFLRAGELKRECESKSNALDPLLENGERQPISTDNQTEEELQLELEKVEEEEKLRRTVLKKLELKRKLALLRKRRESR